MNIQHHTPTSHPVAADPLLSDDLATVLAVLGQEELTEIVGVLNKNRSFTPFPMPVAKNARKAGSNDNLAAHAEEIAREFLWWGGRFSPLG